MLVLPLLSKPKTFYLLRFVASRIAVNFDGFPPSFTKFCHKYATSLLHRSWAYVTESTGQQLDNHREKSRPVSYNNQSTYRNRIGHHEGTLAGFSVASVSP